MVEIVRLVSCQRSGVDKGPFRYYWPVAFVRLEAAYTLQTGIVEGITRGYKESRAGKFVTKGRASQDFDTAASSRCLRRYHFLLPLFTVVSQAVFYSFRLI